MMEWNFALALAYAALLVGYWLGNHGGTSGSRAATKPERREPRVELVWGDDDISLSKSEAARLLREIPTRKQ